MGILDKFFGGSNERELKKIQFLVKRTNELELKIKKLSDEEIRERREVFKKELEGGKTLDDILPEAFAVVREAAWRSIGQRHFDVQLAGGVALHQGKIAEMKTGEGKTLVATLPVYLNAISGKGAHVVTVNDYLSKRDANWMGAIYHFLGLSVACIAHDSSFLYEPKKVDKDEVSVEMENLKPISRKEAYAADITYGTNNEFGFDYLRDNMAPSLEQMAQRPLNYAIVDEVDSILIDEARTPLIISAPDNESTKMYEQFARLVLKLKEHKDYNVDEKMKSATLTQKGITRMEELLGIGNIYETSKVSYVHHLEQALKAQIIFQNDRDYVVKDNEVIIVDDFTGRLMPGRRYSEGLHQAIEAKEGVKVQRESRTLATITFQNYFRIYDKLSGMTGTAVTSAEELHKVYKLEVLEVPTNQIMVRKDLPDMIYKTEQGKFEAIAQEIKRLNKLGQPILVGTIAIEKSELISELLVRSGVKHEVLNAKNHEREAQIITKAGEANSVTIATNMAGRGTDIKLNKESKELGGLHIIGTERHEARRIDNQLRGRSGRQGDPGSTQFFVSLEDELMRRFGGDKLKSLMERLGLPNDQPIENKMISRSIESAQGKIEGYNFDLRKHILDYDDIMNKQREVIYKKRRDILKKEDIKNDIKEMLDEEVDAVVAAHTAVEDEDQWNTEEISEEIETIIGETGNLHKKLIDIKKSKEIPSSLEKKNKIIENLNGLIKEAYAKKEKDLTPEVMRQVEKGVYLRTVDSFWMDHLEQIDHLRNSIGLQGYGQKDPLVEYKKEAFGYFRNLLSNINNTVVNAIFKMQLASPSLDESQASSTLSGANISYSGGEEPTQFQPGEQSVEVEGDGKKEQVQEPVVNQEKVGRNDSCPCGSGKKYKKCCGKDN